MKKRIIACVMAAVIAVFAISFTVFADSTPTLTATPSATSVTQGRSFTLSIKASAFDTVSSVDFKIHYDSAAMTVKSYSNGGLIADDAIISVNTDEAGVVSVSAVDMDGFASSGTLLNVSFGVLSDCLPSTYPIKLTVGDSYGLDLSGVSLISEDTAITVTEAAASQKNFTVYNYLSKSSLSLGDTFSVRSANGNRYSFGSADFEITYDSDVLEVESVVFESALANETATYSVNKDIKGTVLISYANSNAVNAFYMFKVNFKVIADMNGRTTVLTEARNVYAEDLTPYSPYTATSTVTLNKLPEVINHPNMWLDTTDTLIVGQRATGVLKLEQGAGVAAGDFKLTYDTEVLRCTGVTVADGLSAVGGTIIVNDNYGDGTVEFPYVNENGYSDTEISLVVIEWEILSRPDEHFAITIEGSLVSDVNYNAVELEYVTETGCIYDSCIMLPTSDRGACRQYACTCGEGFTEDLPEMDVRLVYTELAGAVAIVPTASGNNAVTRSDVIAMLEGTEFSLDGEGETVGTGATLTVGNETVPVVILGDIDGDGRVTVFDCNIVNKTLGSDFTYGGVRAAAADVDMSGMLEGDDVLAMLSHLTGKSNIN